MQINIKFTFTMYEYILLSNLIYMDMCFCVFVVVIARYRVEFEKYFPSFSDFATYLTAKYEKQGKYMQISHEATCDNYFIVKC